MKEFIDKLISRLEEKFKYNSEQAEIYRDGSDTDAYFREKKDLYLDRANTYGEIRRIVNQLAEEYNDGWIPASVQYEPTEYGKYIVYVRHEENHDISDIFTIAWYGAWNLNSSWDVIAWMPIPDYQPKGE